MTKTYLHDNMHSKSIYLLKLFSLLAFATFSFGLTRAATLNVSSYGVTGNGTTDDSAALQSAFDAASAATPPTTLQIPSGYTIRVTKNLFISGTFDLVGAGPTSSIIKCDADLNSAQGRAYWISVGITNTAASGLGAKKTFVGTIKDLGFYASSNAKFQRCLMLFNTTGTTIDNVRFDFLSGISAGTDVFMFGPVGSGNNGTWEPAGSKPPLANVTIKNSTAAANHRVNDCEGFSLSLVTNVTIDNNVLTGIGDDPIALHTCVNSTVTNNSMTCVDGRIFLSCCTTALIDNNRIERIAVQGGSTWIGGGGFIWVGLESNNSSPASNNITITDNTLILNANIPSFTYGIRLMGVRDALVAGNIIKSDCSSRTDIRVERDGSYSGWNDPTGLDTDHIARPRNIEIRDNLLCGAYPGYIQQTGVATDFPGTYTIKNNIAAGYNWFSLNGISFYNSNVVFDGVYSRGGVTLSGLADPVSFYLDTIPGVTPGGTVSGSTYTAVVPGRVQGYAVSLSPTLTAGSISLELWKNGTKVATTTSITGTGGNYTLNYMAAGNAFLRGDTIQVRAVGSATLAPATGITVTVTPKGLSTVESALYAFDAIDGSGNTTDLSGCLNTGSVTGATTSSDAVLGNSLNFGGSDTVTVADDSSLDITDNLTVSLWFKPSAYPIGTGAYLLKKCTSLTAGNFACTYFGTTSGMQGQIGFQATRGGTWGDISGRYTLTSTAGWTHIALVYNSTTGGQLYINGVATGTATGSGTLTTNNASLTLGAGNTGGLQGKLDQVRIFKRTLTAAEIANLAVAGQ